MKNASSRRTVAETIKDPVTHEIIAQRNTEIDAELAAKIAEAGIDKIKIRSPLTLPREGVGLRTCVTGETSPRRGNRNGLKQ